MGTVTIEKEKNIEFKFKTLSVRMWRFRLDIYFKWDMWTKRYHFMNTGKCAGYKGFVFMFWPFCVSYQVK